LNNQDLKSIINTACKYNDIEVLETIASSKIIKTAGVRDLLQGLGLQMSQTANQSQFKDKNALSSFLTSSSTIDDRETAKEVYNWWAKKIKDIGTSAVNIEIPSKTPSGRSSTRRISFQPRGCIRYDDLYQAFAELPPNDINNIGGAFASIPTTATNVYKTLSDPPTKFDSTTIDSTGASIGLTAVSFAPTEYVNIKKNSGTELGFLDFLIAELNANPPKLADNIHIKMFKMLNSSMTDTAMSSMVRKNALAETPRAGLISNWKYIVSLPKEIENRMGKTPKTMIDYKQKLALKKYGRDLSQILNQRIQFEEYVYNASAGSSASGLKTEMPFYKINELSNNYFMDPSVQAQVIPLMKRTGELLNNIVPELDKDTSLTRKIINTVVTPSDYLNSRGKEFH